MNASRDKHSEFEKIRHLASVAREFNEVFINSLSELPPIQSKIHPISLRLLRASLDLGMGLLVLIETNPQDLAAPGLVLHRSQIETFLRGVYLGFLATNEQIKNFMEEDKYIRKKTKNGKWEIISFEKMSLEVEPFIKTLSENGSKHDGRLSEMVKNLRDTLNGFVHGGAIIHSVYANDFGQIGCQISAAKIARFIRNSFIIGNITLALIIVKIHNLSDIQDEEDLCQKCKKFFELYEQIKSTAS